MPKPTRPRKTKKLTKKSNSKVDKDFNQFRHEIYKLGLSGLDKKDQVDARIELAIKLGAKPKTWIKPHTDLGSLASRKVNDGAPREADKHIKVDSSSSARISKRSNS